MNKTITLMPYSDSETDLRAELQGLIERAKQIESALSTKQSGVRPAFRAETPSDLPAHARTESLLVEVTKTERLAPNKVRITFADVDGRRLQWIGTSGSAQSLRVGDVLQIKGTVIRQRGQTTVLSRVRIA